MTAYSQETVSPNCPVARGLGLAEVGVAAACGGPGAASGQWLLAWAVPHIHACRHTHTPRGKAALLPGSPQFSSAL